MIKLDNYSVGRLLVVAKKSGYEIDSTDSSYQQGFLSAIRSDSKKKCGPTAIACGDTCISNKKKCLYDKYGATLEREERDIAFLPKERLVVIDPETGKIKAKIDGDETSVAIPDISKLKGSIVTHNHPDQGFPPGDPRAAGISFSPADIAVACYGEVAQVRAVSPGYRYSMSPPDGGWNDSFFREKVAPSYQRNFISSYYKNYALVNLGLRDYRYASRQIHHETWEKVAKETGMRYSTTQIPNERRKAKNASDKARNLASHSGGALIRLSNYAAIAAIGTLATQDPYEKKQVEQDTKRKELVSKALIKKQLEKRIARGDSAKPKCKTGKPCKNVCIPKKSKCRDKVTAQTPKIPRVAGVVASGLAVGATAAIALDRLGAQKRLVKTLKQEESNIINLKEERAVLLDPKTGRVKLRVDGDQTSVTFKGNAIKQLKGSVFTHNHPDQGFPPGDPRSSGASFSIADIAIASAFEVSEMRAVSPGYRFSMKPPKEGWNPEFLAQKIAPSYQKNFRKTYYKNLALVATGVKDYREATRNVYHETWEKVAKETGMKYERTEIPSESLKPLTEGDRRRKLAGDIGAIGVRGMGLSVATAVAVNEARKQSDRTIAANPENYMAFSSSGQVYSARNQVNDQREADAIASQIDGIGDKNRYVTKNVYAKASEREFAAEIRATDSNNRPTTVIISGKKPRKPSQQWVQKVYQEASTFPSQMGKTPRPEALEDFQKWLASDMKTNHSQP